MYFRHINNTILVAQLFAYEENVATGHSYCCEFFCKCSIAYLVTTIPQRK